MHGGTQLTCEEIGAKARALYESAGDINSIAEAQEAVRTAASLIYYLSKQVTLSKGGTQKAGSLTDFDKDSSDNF